ncbi:hypothetical protein O4J56_27265 [Nocardiopsis sp. RSe5-2]|uniref:Type II toxin-antitoxin system RelE/ParE family toxin n=1 Tax=Nocardiopsis endophytica TaxID=3018445 RepID=A0ABT4UDI6_9ACTN|nr:hypothetical protein [Nocardiopsis endophytica]MDA2814377.1 hypothetical protein [Nocardiopsis endophytica]
MNYRIEFTAKGDAETVGLPSKAFTALIETLSAVGRDPWSAGWSDDAADPLWRWAPFGEDGVVLFYVDTAQSLVRVHTVTWVG